MTLLGHLVRAMPWVPWLPVSAGIAGLAWAVQGLQPDFASRQLYLRGGLLLAALAISFAFDDPAAETTEATPSPLRRRRSLRLIVSLIPWAALVTVVVLTGTTQMHPVLVLSSPLDSRELPVGRLLLEAATMASWGLATASALAFRGDDEPGKIASGTLLAVYAAAWIVPERWKPWADPADPRWNTALAWWLVALGAGVFVAVVFRWDSRQSGTLGIRLSRYRQLSQCDDTRISREPSGVEVDI